MLGIVFEICLSLILVALTAWLVISIYLVIKDSIKDRIGR